MSITINRTDQYAEFNVSAPSNRGYITIDTSDWINKPWMFYELPALKFEIYTESGGELVKYQNFTREIRTYNPVYSPLGVLNVTIDIRNVPEEFILRITPIFDNNAVAARNMLIENGIEDGEIWGKDQDIPTQSFDLNIEFIECTGEYIPPTPPIPPTHEETVTFTEPPYTFDDSDGSPIISLTIKGNGQQNGTPSPDNIIMPEFVGVKSENLFDKTGEIYPWNEAELTFSGNTIRATAQKVRTQCYAAILLSNTQQLLGKTLTLSATITQSTPTNTGGLRVFWYNGNYPEIAVYQDQPETGYATATFTVPDTIPDGMQCLCILFTANWYGTCEIGDYVDYENVVLNEGDNAEPFVPYGESGWKIPITCGGENLFDKSAQAGQIYVTDSALRYGVEIPVPSGTYTVSGGTSTSFAKTKIGDVYGEAISLNAPRVFTLASDGYMLVYASNQVGYDEAKVGIMLNLGSTPKPYAPYSRQTNIVYLGQTQTIRRVKKQVLTGNEWWGKEGGVLFYNDTIIQMPAVQYADAYCSHYRLGSSYTDVAVKESAFGVSKRPAIFIHDTRFSATADFKSYLVAQYEAGTPVTVWYILEEPTTGIINEPLAKIGDYADELSSEDSGVTIPTASGDNVLIVETDLQPSEMTITYMKEGQ